MCKSVEENKMERQLKAEILPTILFEQYRGEPDMHGVI